MSGPSKALRARYVFPVAGPPIDGGMVVIEGANIAAVGKNLSADRVEDLGDVAIVPGLVNAHTHLEFSALSRPLGTPGMSLPGWIRLVIEHRQTGGAAPLTAIAAGLGECLAAGTSCVGEIATTDWRATTDVPAAIPTTVMFHESIGPTPARFDAARMAAAAFLAAQQSGRDILPALSPHAPYTVHPRLLAAIVDLSRQRRVPVAMHLAESREELELLASGTGPFRDLLDGVGAWDASSDGRLPSIGDYLAELANAPRALVIHGNYLNEAEVAFLAEHRQTMSVVYCPRMHHFFRHDPYPLAARLAAGVSLALGTDSRASNPDLSLFAEMRFVAAHHPDVDPATILQMGTIGGATALGLGERMGTIEPRKQADLAVIALPAASADDPHELLFHPESRIVAPFQPPTPNL